MTTIGRATTNGTGSTGRGGAACPSAVAGQGVTASQINIAATIISIAGSTGNSAFGVPSPTEQQNDWQYVADAINASGGAGCRKLAMSYYTVNPVDSSNAQQQCLAIANAGPFVALDSGALEAVGAGDCIPAQKIPLVSAYITGDQIKKYYPYYISPSDVLTHVLSNGMVVLGQEGYFSAAKGFAKLGILYDDCVPAYYDSLRHGLSQAGVPDSKIVVYNYGCQSGGANSPADDEQAVLAFQQAGVTDVTEAGDAYVYTFTKVAGQQGLKPIYIFSDPTATNNNSKNSTEYDTNNFDSAITITDTRFGEESTPGYQPSPETARCNAIFAAHGVSSVYQQPIGYGGTVCGYLLFVVAMIDRAPSLQRAALVAGMNSVGSNYDSSYPFGPTNFAAAPQAAGYGISYWRTDEFFKSCACWRVTDPTFHPAIS